MAFDTSGLELFRATRNPDMILEGFYFDDTEGVEPNAAVVGNEALGLGAKNLVRDEAQSRILGGIGLGVFVKVKFGPILLKLGTEVGFFAGQDLNFNDPNGDGRVRGVNSTG